MRLWPWILSLVFPLCATQGSQGVAVPGVVNFSHLSRARLSSALIAPPGLAPNPDFIAPVFNESAEKLFADMQAVSLTQPRTTPLGIQPLHLQISFVVRSAAANFPDVIELAALPVGTNQSTYVFYSHSVYGGYAWGVNLDRAKYWAAALQQRVGK